jgi:hypothetical protein
MSILAHLSRLKLTKTTLSDTLRPKQPSERSFALSSNCLGFESWAKPLVAVQFICVPNRRVKNNIDCTVIDC